MRVQRKQDEKHQHAELEWTPFIRGLKMGNSTGPRTPRGKARSSQNAAKHWIESSRILPEERKQAAMLHKGFVEDFDPQGTTENELIDDLTINRLIKRRIDNAFTREFAKAAIEKTVRLAEDYETSATQFWRRATGEKYWAESGLGERLRPDMCIDGLEKLKRKIGEHGPQSEDLAELRLYYGEQPTEHAALVMYDLVPGQDQTADEKDQRKDILETIDAEIAIQKNRLELAEAAHAIDTATDFQEPARPVLDTLLRYRSSNIREFRDLLDCFKRIRRLRCNAA
jgi:hypothetical protein